MPLLFYCFCCLYCFRTFRYTCSGAPTRKLLFRCTYRGVLLSVEVIASHCINLHAALVLHEDAVMSAACDRKVMRQTSRSLHVARIVQSVHDADPELTAIWCRCCRHMNGLPLSHPELVAYHARTWRHTPVKSYLLIRAQQRADDLKLRIRILQGIVGAVHHT